MAYQHRYVFRLIGTHPEKHLVEHNTQGPDVSLHCVVLASKYFRSHVDGRPQHCFGHVLSWFQPLAEPEICQLDPAITKQNIFGLDVPVHDVVPIQNFEGLEKLPEDMECLFLGEGALLFEGLEEGPPIAVLVYKVVVIFGLEVVLVPDDVL